MLKDLPSVVFRGGFTPLPGGGSDGAWCGGSKAGDFEFPDYGGVPYPYWEMHKSPSLIFMEEQVAVFTYVWHIRAGGRGLNPPPVFSFLFR